MESPTPRQTTNGPQPIHPAIRKVWLFSNLISYAIIAVITSAVEWGLIKGDILPWSFPIAMPLFWLGIGVLSASLVKRQWEVWRYEITDQEVILRHGIWNQIQRFVPRDRVQHVDITSGPLARKFGLVHVHLYVAGAHGSVGEIPGLTPDEAEELRKMLVETQADHV
ncbi:MAG: PH domain-containing protein [Armatimonadetes bacterium]|nr:PH domain-containing protein [Armatimonadota bacterium]